MSSPEQLFFVFSSQSVIERVQKGKLALRLTRTLLFHMFSFKRTQSYYDIYAKNLHDKSVSYTHRLALKIK